LIDPGSSKTESSVASKVAVLGQHRKVFVYNDRAFNNVLLTRGCARDAQ
jgi:hypothetical protein